MARYNLQLDYEILEQLAASCNKLATSFDNVKSSISGVETSIQNCSGEAVKALSGQGDEIVKSIEKLGDGLGKFGSHISKYCNDMQAIIDAASAGMLQVNSVDVKWNLKQIIDDILDFDDYARGAKSGVTVDGIGDFYSSVITQEDKAAIRQVEDRIGQVKELMVVAAKDIMKYEDDFERFRKIISDFENKDDEYRDTLQEIYYEISDAGFFNKTCNKIIIGVALIVIAAAIVFLAPVLATIGGVVGTIAGAIASCGWLVSIATEVLAVGTLTASFAGGIAVYTGEDIEDAFGGGLFDGTVSSVVTGGFGQIAKAPKYLAYGSKILNKTPLKNNVVAKETVEFAMSEGMELAGEFFGALTVDALNGKDINYSQLALHSVIDRSAASVFKQAHEFVDEKINIPDVQLIRDGKFSLNDLKHAIRNGVNDKSLDALKDVVKQVGKGQVDNFIAEQENPQEEQSGVDINPDEVSESVVKSDLKGRMKDGIDSYTENAVRNLDIDGND